MQHFNPILRATVILLVASSLFLSCKKDTRKAPPKIDPAFTGYIAAFTSGVVSNQSVITIELIDAVPEAIPGQVIDKKLFGFSPKIEGECYWADQRTIEFKPKELLPSGKLIEAGFQLHKLMEVPEKVKTLKFQFEVKKQSIRVNYTGNEPYEQTNLQWQKLKGKLLLNDYAPVERIPELLTAVQDGKKLNIRWEEGVEQNQFVFIVDSVARTESKGSVIFEWDGKPIGIGNKGDFDIDIPPLGDFKVVNSIVTQAPTQHITLYFSDPLKTNQELEGLIRLANNVPLRVVIRDNMVMVYPNRRLTAETEVIVESGVRNIMNYQMSERFQGAVRFSNIKPAVKLIGKGVILPNSNGLTFPFKAVNLRAVDVKIIKIFEDNVAQHLQVNQLDGDRELKRVGRIVYRNEVELTSEQPIDHGKWNTFALDLSKMIETEPGAIYRVFISFDKSQSLYPCEDADNDEQLPASHEEEDESFEGPSGGYSYYDDYDYYWNDGDYNYQDRDNPCTPSYYHRYTRRAVARNVLASDLGIIAKGGNSKELFVAVSDLVTSRPMANVELSIFNYQNQLIATSKTDDKGMARIGLDKKPFLLVARYGKQNGYLRLDDGSSLSLSMFDVGGQKTKKGLKGYIYGERGVWRPGDSLFVTFMLEDKLDVIPENHPVSFELYTPENQLYLKRIRSNPVNGFYDFRTATEQEAPTGNWLAVVRVGGAKFTKSLKIEAVKPNRLKINLDFGAEIIKSGDPLRGELEVKWLHGAIAKNLQADVNVSLTQGKTTFKDFPGFVFDDPIKDFDSEEISIFDGRLNAEGKALITPNFSVSSSAPGMVNANFKVRAFEEGGDFSVDRFTLPYSPFESYAGLKIPKGEGWNGAIYSNEPNIVPIMTVDEEGKPVDRKKVKIEVYEIRWRWWWERSEDDDLARYISRHSSSRMILDYINTVEGKALYELNFGRNTWGRKYIRITDPVSGHSAGAIFYTSYKGWWNSSGGDNPGGAEMLTFSTDKVKYSVGEEVTVQLPATETGRALVSIESGSSVVDAFWIETGKESNTFKFKATPEMAPNVYLHIAYMQPHNQVKNDLPIRMYGVQPIRVEDPETHLTPVINMPDVLAPLEKVTIKVNEKNGKDMAYTLAMVDDGLLDLTRFKTPNAWKQFYAREALGVKTWDMYQYVVGAYGGELAGLLALGGDEEIGKKGGEKANRFKPVVKFIGPVYLNGGKTNTHTFTMPNYVGSVRIMVVGGNNGVYGSAEKTSPVKKPLMVLATMPRVVGPTEKVKLPVTVFAMDDKIKNVSVEVETNAFMSIIGNKKKSISFDKQGDQMVSFDLDVKELIGIGKVKVTAKSGNIKAEYDVELDVRVPNPRTTNIVEGIIEPGKTWSSPYKPVGIAGTNNGTVEVSSIPPLNLEERLKYLIRYPHGCIEQTTSSVFPQLHLGTFMNLDKTRKAKIQNNIEAGIERLRTFQISNGGLSYWPGEYDYANEWGTNYAGHFMLEAQAKGYSLPAGFINNWIKFQRERANAWEPIDQGHYYYRSGEIIQAYRLYTLALAGKPAIGAMNRMREMNKLSTAAKWRLAAAYLLVGRENVAKELIKNQDTQIKYYRELSYSYGSSIRDQAMILEALVLMNDISQAKVVYNDISKAMASKSWHSTQTTAYSLLAIAKFIGNDGIPKGLDFIFAFDKEKETKVNSKNPIYQVPIDFSDTQAGTVNIKNESVKRLFVRIITDGIPIIGDQLSAENNLKMSVKYLDLQGQPLDVGRLEQGTDFMAEVRLKHPGIRNNYKEMALTQIFPSGWEIRNLRMEEGGSIHIIDNPRYQDIRDDRVYSYFDLNQGKPQVFRILLNASYLGRFYLPTVYCEAMYDNEINAKVPGQWVEVIKSGVPDESITNE